MTETASQPLPAHPDDKRTARLAQIRRDLHWHPELSWLEYLTSAVIAEHLAGLGYAVRAAALGRAHHWLQHCHFILRILFPVPCTARIY